MRPHYLMELTLDICFRCRLYDVAFHQSGSVPAVTADLRPAGRTTSEAALALGWGNVGTSFSPVVRARVRCGASSYSASGCARGMPR